MKIILYSQTFKGYLKIYENKQGNELTGYTLKFDAKKENATTFISQHDKDEFIKNYCIGVNYNFKVEII